MAVSPALLTLATVGIGLAGAVVSTTAQVNAANYQAHIAQQNQDIANQNAARAIQRSQEVQYEQDQKSAFEYGALVASQGASGLGLGGRSFILSRKSARELGRMDALNVRDAGQVEAANYELMAQDQGAEGQLYTQQASSDLLGGFISGAGSLIGGYSKLNSQGFFNPTGSAYRPGGWGSGAFA